MWDKLCWFPHNRQSYRVSDCARECLWRCSSRLHDGSILLLPSLECSMSNPTAEALVRADSGKDTTKLGTATKCRGMETHSPITCPVSAIDTGREMGTLRHLSSFFRCTLNRNLRPITVGRQICVLYWHKIEIVDIKLTLYRLTTTWTVTIDIWNVTVP